MLVEDSDDVRWLVRFHLEHAGYEVREPVDWEQLLEPSAWEGIDVAVVDLHLAAVVTGVHVLRYLSEHLPDVRRVVFTASVAEDPTDPAYLEAVSLGHAYVSKFRLADYLIEAVKG